MAYYTDYNQHYYITTCSICGKTTYGPCSCNIPNPIPIHIPKYIKLHKPTILEYINPPRNERALIVLAPDKKSQLEFAITRKRMEAYAAAHSLDFIAITQITHQEHVCANKYAYTEVAKNYIQSLWVDTDVIIKYDTPNIFDLVPLDHWGLVDDFQFMGEQKWFIEEWALCQKYWGVPVTPIDRAWNSGIVVAPQDCERSYYPPPMLVPNVWCAEQHWHTQCLTKDKVISLPHIWNNGFPWTHWEAKLKSSYFNHANGAHPHSLRLALLECLDKEEPIPYSIWDREGRSGMTECKHLDLDTCTIINQLTGTEFYPSPEECAACSRCHEPRTVNEITSSLANKILVELERPTLYQIGHGPGTRLARTISWFHTQPPGCDCEDRAKIMDSWGVEGCKRNTKTIVHWLYESAHLSNIKTTRSAIEMIVFILLKTPYKEKKL